MLCVICSNASQPRYLGDRYVGDWEAPLRQHGSPHVTTGTLDGMGYDKSCKKPVVATSAAAEPLLWPFGPDSVRCK